MKRYLPSVSNLLSGKGFRTGLAGESWDSKPSPDKALTMLKEGNIRFYKGKTRRPHANAKRLKQAGTESQARHAFATVIACSDSRVPVELIFDAGIMDIFTVRVAGNVCDTTTIGSIEFGLAHVLTPLLVVLGHTQCGAVTAAVDTLQGNPPQLEPNLRPLVEKIQPAVKRAMEKHPMTGGDNLIPLAIEKNVRQSIEDLFMQSPTTRDLAEKGKVKVIGAIYDVATGKINWLPPEMSTLVLHEVDMNPNRVK